MGEDDESLATFATALSNATAAGAIDDLLDRLALGREVDPYEYVTVLRLM